MTMNITEADIQRLIHDPSVKVRQGITEKICRGFSGRDFSERERTIAVEILRLLLKDTAARVRKAMSQELCHCIDLPRDIAIGLAYDDDDIAEAILRHSPALEEEDLIQLVESCNNLKKMNAVARRDSISPELSRALVKHGDSQVTCCLLNNKGASINESTLEYLLDEYHQDQSVLQALVYRGGLPYRYAEKLFTLVSNHLKKDLSKRYRLSRHVVDDITENAREVAVMEFLSPWMSAQDIRDLVVSMHRNKRLTDSVIIRALCAGNLRFFETAMAVRGDISINNARILLLDAGNRGFDALYDATNMPDTFRDAIRILFKIAQQETQFGQYYHDHFSQRMIERIVQEGHESKIQNMPYLLSIIGRSVKDVPTLH